MNSSAEAGLAACLVIVMPRGMSGVASFMKV